MSHFLRGVAARCSVLTAAVVCSIATPSHAGFTMMSEPVLNPATGSYYAYVTAGTGGITWGDANAAAPSLKHLGSG
jgi:hypothetical protein